jgi:hypothetical protein
MKTLSFLLLVIAFLLATVVLGWWAVPAAGALWALLAPPWRWIGLRAALAAGVAWALLLGWGASRGPLLDLADRLAGIFRLPRAGVLALPVVFAMLLAGSAAALVAALRPGAGASNNP